MYIIDKNKDYYDYLSSPHIYGTDKSIVLDRRGSTVITDKSLVNLVYSPYTPSSSFRKIGYFFLLEIGFEQHIIEVIDIKFREEWMRTDELISCSFKKVYTFSNNKPTHLYSDLPISIREVSLDYVWGNKGREFKYKFDSTGSYSFSDIIRTTSDNQIVKLPILKETSLTSLFTPEEIWRALQTYLSSLNNDQDKETDLTDVERAEIHGFDKKTSFRNPIK
jgi:hypothetical protein